MTKKRVDTILEGVRTGNTFSASIEAAGLARRTVYQWIEQGEPDDSGAYPKNAYGDFASQLAQARAEAEQEAVKTIRSAMAKNWQAAAWWLERSKPGEWGRVDRSKVELTGKDGEPLRVIHDAAADLDGELDRLAARIGTQGGTETAGADA